MAVAVPQGLHLPNPVPLLSWSLLETQIQHMASCLCSPYMDNGCRMQVLLSRCSKPPQTCLILVERGCSCPPTLFASGHCEPPAGSVSRACCHLGTCSQIQEGAVVTEGAEPGTAGDTEPGVGPVSPGRCIWCPWQSSWGEFRVFWEDKPWP